MSADEHIPTGKTGSPTPKETEQAWHAAATDKKHTVSLHSDPSCAPLVAGRLAVVSTSSAEHVQMSRD